MKLQYNLKYTDYLLYNMWHQLFSVRLQILFLGMTLLITYEQIKESSPLEGAIVFLMFFVILWLIQQTFNVFLLFSRKNKSILTLHDIEVTDEAFVEETQYNKSYHYWPGIEKVSTYPGIVAVYISAHGAHFIPNRAFDSTSKKNQFVEILNSKMKESVTSV